MTVQRQKETHEGVLENHSLRPMHEAEWHVLAGN